MPVNAKILLDSVNHQGQRLTTVLLPRLPKPLFGQLSKHRMLSMSAASSRAIPLERLIRNILEDDEPKEWTQKQSGMGGSPLEDTATLLQLDALYKEHRDAAILTAREMHRLGAAKENVNRLLEPFARLPVIVTGTEWGNFFSLRLHPASQHELRQTAAEMRALMAQSEPKRLGWGEWHIPWADDLEGSEALFRSVAACARCSYANHEGKTDPEKDRELFGKLKSERHWTPFEHQAFAAPGAHANLRGFCSLRNDLGA